MSCNLSLWCQNVTGNCGIRSRSLKIPGKFIAVKCNTISIFENIAGFVLKSTKTQQCICASFGISESELHSIGSSSLWLLKKNTTLPRVISSSKRSANTLLCFRALQDKSSNVFALLLEADITLGKVVFFFNSHREEEPMECNSDSLIP